MNIDEARNKILDFELDEENYPELPSEFWKNEEFIMCCLKNDHHISAVFNNVDKSMWMNKDFVLSLIEYAKGKEDWQLDETKSYIDAKLKQDEDVIKAFEK